MEHFDFAYLQFKKINIESVYRISLRIIIIGIISVLFLCLIGILPDILTSRDTLEQIDYNRHSLGFYHSNVFPLLIFIWKSIIFAL